MAQNILKNDQTIETADFDSLDNIAMPRAQTQLYHHQDKEQAFLTTIKEKKAHHAWLIHGKKGIGKATLAYRLSRVLLNQDKKNIANEDTREHQAIHSQTHPLFRQVESLSHPDLLVLRRRYLTDKKRFSTNIPVDDVKQTLTRLQSHATGLWRVVVIDCAEDLAKEGANALLKTLEEPPQNTIFFIISHMPGRLLPTIVSRCQKLGLSSLPSSIIESALAQQNIKNIQERELIAELSDGSLRNAYELAMKDGLDLYKEFAALLEILPNYNTLKLHHFIDHILKKKEQNIPFIMGFIYDWLSRRVHRQKEPLVSAELTFHAPAHIWSDLWYAIREKEHNFLKYNLDPKSFLLSIFITISNKLKKYIAEEAA